GSRNSRSARLPTLPPSSAPSAIAQPREPSRREMRTMTTATTTATIVNTHVEPVAKLNAAPELNTSSRPNASPSTGTLTPGVRPASAMAFVTWSATRTPTASSHRAAGSRRRRTSCESRPTAAGPSLRTVDLALGTGTGTCEGTAPLDVVEQTLEVALEAGAVVALEHAELVDLALEQRALALELAERAVALLLGLAGDPLGLGTGLGEDALGLRLAVAHVLVVDALRQRDQAGRGLRLALRRLRRGSGVGGRRGRLRLGLRLDGRLGDRGHLLRALLGRRRSGGRLLQA